MSKVLVGQFTVKTCATKCITF